MPLLWLSFADDDKFRGVVITEAEDVGEATQKLYRLGVNPGGQVLCFQIPPHAMKERGYPRDTILTAEFLQGDGHKKLKDCPPEVQRELGME